MLVLPSLIVPIKPVLGAEQPQYTLYKNANYGFSIEYPATWYHEDLTATGGNLSPVAYFAPDSQTKNAWLSVNYQKSSTALHGLSDQQIVNTLTTTMQHNCQQYSIQTNGFTCSNPQFKSAVEKYRGLPSYEIMNTWTKTLPDGSTLGMISIWAMVPVQNDLYAVVVRLSSDAVASYQNEISHMLSSFNIYSVPEETVAQKPDYSNFGLQKGESISYKYSMTIDASDSETKQAVTNTMLQSLSQSMGNVTLNSIDDVEWLKYTVTNVSSTNILFNEETKIKNQETIQNLRDIKYLQGMAIPITAKIGDTFDIFSSGAGAGLQGTVKDIPTIKLQNIDVPVFELSGSTSTVSPDGTTVSTMSGTAYYDKKTGLMLSASIDANIVGTKYVKMHIEVNPIDFSGLGTVQISKSVAAVPSWVKNTAKWWAEGTVTESDFINGIQYMVQQGLIKIPTTTVAKQSQGVPSWVKTTAKWWAEGTVTDSDFIKGIQYLVQNGIISTTPPETSMTSAQLVTYADKDGASLSVFAIPKEVLLFVSSDSNPDVVKQMISDNGGKTIYQIPEMGFYFVNVDDVSKFISSSYKYSFVIDSFPNEILSDHASTSGSTTIGYIDRTTTNWNDVSIPTNTKVLMVQIDNFVYGAGDNTCPAPHGVCVSRQNDRLNNIDGITSIRLQDKHGPNDHTDDEEIVKDIQYAISIAEHAKAKLVINLSLGKPTSDDTGKLYSDAQERVKSDVYHFLDAAMGTDWFKNGNVIISQAAPNDHMDLGKTIQDLQQNNHYGGAFKSYIITSQTKADDNGNQILTTFKGGSTTAYGNGIVFVKREDNCGGGTSCAVYGTTATQAQLWLSYPNLTSSQMVNLIKSNTSIPPGGKYPVVDLKGSFLAAWQQYKCVYYCTNYGQQDNKINQLGQSQQSTQSPDVTNNQKTQPSQGQYGGYNTPEEYCQAKYGSSYQYDSSQHACVPSSSTSGGVGQGSSALGIDLTGQWGGTARGTIVLSSDQLTCSYSANINLNLQQKGTTLSGPVSVSNISLSGEGCDAVGFSTISGSLSATIFGSGFSGTVDILTVKGQFTQDLMRGTYSGGSGDYTISGDFTASRTG